MGGSAGPAAASQAGAIAKLLEDTSEDKTQLVYCVAGIQTKAPMTMCMPACAAASALASMNDMNFVNDITNLLRSGTDSMDVKTSAAYALGELGVKAESAL